MEKLKKYLYKYLDNTTDPYINAKLAEEYEKLGQGASALSFFLRAAELTWKTDPEFAYCCVLKTWKQMHKTTRRPNWERKQLQTAIAFLPQRPEAYLHLSLWHSSRKEWKPSYMYACLGIEHTGKDPLIYDVDYPGDYMLLFQKAYTAWYVGQRKESAKLWKELGTLSNVKAEHMQIIQNNILNLC